MDQYLVPNATFKRLYEEYKLHSSLFIGVDFDGTIHDYHKTGASHDMVVKLLKDLKRIGCKIICWTAYKEHEYVEKFFKDREIPLDGININGIPLNYETRKPFFSVLLDDRAGLGETYRDLELLIWLIDKEEYEKVY